VRTSQSHTYLLTYLLTFALISRKSYRCDDDDDDDDDLRGRQTIDKFDQLLWAWFSFLRKSADNY